ncbi:hypothetical protein IX317_002132 [Fusobacterium sp. DD29]|uniref:hypothetical protein n=1 Tax=unclassified Fusobacterium TaxID=2648384 RepID=UPI001B8DA2DD|nr:MULTISPECIES: hypothetical protein [unclassified Fusobacterium]MBR8750410.1 hypothetical protein [Fusobacterium sp. DD29]MBR8762651.1 hypothetical protein [Fusobacterium sp. DD25]MBR8768692.1 hypothetical protein [Fusobacterium sp. DD43]MBR8772765.1 hypothetical protein [Fusobacterium sp. DD40]MBR8776974.1 hypothetical protein [Fusobacterium sp. DD17]
MELTEKIEELFELAKSQGERQEVKFYKLRGTFYLNVGNFEWEGYNAEELIDQATEEMRMW